MIVLQEYQDHKWRAVAAVAAAYASTPPLEVAQTSVVADTCCAVLDEISDGLSIIVDKTLPFVLFSLKEVLRMYASTVDADVERVAAVLDLVFDALRQVKLHNEVIQGIASALLQEAIWAQ